jgi:hypothetical protein
LAIPEILEYEIHKHFQKHTNDSIAHIHQGYNDLEILMGYRDDYIVPDSLQINKRVSDRLNELKDFIVFMPFSLEHAKHALRRVIDEVPPNGPKNQQFKDSVIWETLLEFSENYDIHFVTRDTGFFEKGKPENGLSQILKEELKDKTIHVYFGLSEFLEAFQDKIPSLNTDRLAEMIFEALETPFSTFCKDRNYDPGNLDTYIIQPYLTEDTSKVTIDYELFVNVLQNKEDSPQAEEVQALIKGTTSYNLNSESLDETPTLELVEFYDLEGNRLPGGLITARGEIVIGRKKVYHKIKRPFPFKKNTEKG